MKYLWGPWQLTAYAVIALIFINQAFANPYIEYKHKQSLDTSSKYSDYLRLGYKFENNFYLETSDEDAEIGFKQKFGNLLVKGKVESTNNFDKNGAEIEVRYTFK